MRVVVAVLGAVGVVVTVGFVVVYSGVYNVAASYPHSAFTTWLLHTAMTRSVRRYAKEVASPPPDLASLAADGAPPFAEMCAPCHGAPGVEPAELGRGLMPPSPDLAEVAAEWSERELYWIIKNGVRYTGMPAWEQGHGEEALWALVAFVQALPSLSPETYRDMVTSKQ